MAARPDGKGGADGNENVDITVNGKGPTLRFRIGVMAIMNALILLVGFSITFSILRADVETLKVESKTNASQIHVVVEKLSAIETALDFIREDIRDLRDDLAASQTLRSRGTKDGGRTGDGQ